MLTVTQVRSKPQVELVETIQPKKMFGSLCVFISYLIHPILTQSKIMELCCHIWTVYGQSSHSALVGFKYFTWLCVWGITLNVKIALPSTTRCSPLSIVIFMVDVQISYFFKKIYTRLDMTTITPTGRRTRGWLILVHFVFHWVRTKFHPDNCLSKNCYYL